MKNKGLDKYTKTVTRSSRLSMKTRTNTLLVVVLFLFVIGAVAPSAHAQGGLIAWWPGDGNANDVVGGHHGSFFNGATTAPGIVGQAFSFDGVDDFVRVSDSSFMPLTSAPRTVTLWFKSDKNLVDSPESAMFFYGDEGAGAGFVFSLITSVNARGKLYWFGWGVPPRIDLPGVTTLQQDTWYFAAATWDGHDVNLWLGSEGVLHHEGIRYTPTIHTVIASPDNGVLIGAREDWPRWDGLIDEVKVYDRALTYEELLSQFLPPTNQAPTATDDFYGVDQLATLNEPAPGVLVNDSDPDAGNTLTAVLVTGPSHAASFQLNSDGSFSYVPLANYNGPDTFTYRASDGTLSSQTATVNITVRQNCSQGGFITGGGEFLQDGRRRTFGFVAKVQGNGVQGHLEFQDHGGSMNVRSQNMQMVYAANSSDGYFSGACKVNGAQGYTFFVQVHDRGQPGSNDDFSVWIYDLFGAQVYTSGGLLSGGNIRIHETAAAAVTNVEWMCDNDGDHTWVPSGFSCTAPAGNCVILDGNIPPSGYDRDDNDPSVQ